MTDGEKIEILNKVRNTLTGLPYDLIIGTLSTLLMEVISDAPFPKKTLNFIIKFINEEFEKYIKDKKC